jgi:hypothetical protein
MEEAEELCDRVAVIDHGTVLASGTVDSLRGSAGADTVITVTYDGAVPSGIDSLRGRDGVSKVEVSDGQVRVFAREPDGLHAVRWLQIAVLLNPLVYASEGLRAALTPQVGHMPTWAFLTALIGGTAMLSWFAMRKFTDRVLT